MQSSKAHSRESNTFIWPHALAEEMLPLCKSSCCTVNISLFKLCYSFDFPEKMQVSKEQTKIEVSPQGPDNPDANKYGSSQTDYLKSSQQSILYARHRPIWVHAQLLTYDWITLHELSAKDKVLGRRMGLLRAMYGHKGKGPVFRKFFACGKSTFKKLQIIYSEFWIHLSSLSSVSSIPLSLV